MTRDIKIVVAKAEIGEVQEERSLQRENDRRRTHLSDEPNGTRSEVRQKPINAATD